MELRVEPVCDKDRERAFEVIRAAGRWLQSRGLRQRIGQTCPVTWLDWQRSGANFAVYRESDPVGVFSLPRAAVCDWPGYDDRPVCWLRALATHPRWRGKGIGTMAVRAALARTRPGQVLYLDCVSGFLPGYYGRFGFQVLDRQPLPVPGEPPLDITLMGCPPTLQTADSGLKRAPAADQN